MYIGFREIDETIDINRPQLTVLGSRPGMGKSSFALNIISNIFLNQEESVLYFNLESSKELIRKRTIALNLLRDQKDINPGFGYGIFKDDMKNDYDISKVSKNDKLIVDTTPNISIEEIYRKSLKMKIEEDIKLIVIDYLQLIRYEKNDISKRNEQLQEILRILKVTSKELDVPIIVLSQLSSEVDKRQNHKPMMFDFSDCKMGVYNYVDNVLMLYRDDYYNEYSERRNIAEILIVKNKLGKLKSIDLVWIPNYFRFSDFL